MTDAVVKKRPAFYALASGGWRDYITLLHPPYTVWHLSYVAIGASMARDVDGGHLAWSLLAFFSAVGVSAHALDELRGRPLGTSIPSWVLAVLGALGLAGALTLGVLGSIRVSEWMVAFMVVGLFVALAYNLELFGGAFHTDLWFALGWGGLPALTGYFAQEGRISPEAVLVALACVAVSAAQRALSTPVRALRRRALRIDGEVVWQDGRTEVLDEGWVRRPSELALKMMSLAVPLLALAMVLAAFARR